MSNIIIETPQQEKKPVFRAGDFVFYDGGSTKYVGMIYLKSYIPRVIWSDGSDTAFKLNMHHRFVGVLTVS